MNCFDYVCEKLQIENEYSHIGKDKYKENIIKAITEGKVKRLKEPKNGCFVLFPEGKHIGYFNEGLLFHLDEKDGELIEPYFLRKGLKFFSVWQ